MRPNSQFIRARKPKFFHRFPQLDFWTNHRHTTNESTTRLLDCETFRIYEFHETSIPNSYAILSHTWGPDEATYQDVKAKGLGVDVMKVGWFKTRSFCQVALHHGYKYCFADTCCIDKQDPAELSEAINSMFRWYANSSVCYAYLSDVPPGKPIGDSRWFSRGWTLQELIAPSKMIFFDREWGFIGTRDTLCDDIQRRSGVDKVILDSTTSSRNINNALSKIPVARRMSWAAGRFTTREEDRAYSLLGIFGVNMPMLYGEGRRAFIRLQEEIAKEINDLSLFAWTRQEDPYNSCNPANTAEESTGAGLSGEEVSKPCGIFAASPDDFQFSHDLVLKRDIKYNPEFTITNKGLKITIEATETEENIWRVSLGCRTSGGSRQDTIGILLKELGGGEFVRWNADRWAQWQGDYQGHETTFYVKKFVDEITAEPVYKRSIQFQARGNIRFENATPKGYWSPKTAMFVTDGLDFFEGFVFCHFDGAKTFQDTST
ncbi:HET domain-containing protein [Colletotrichum camelliae]|nr:HET domain-containing protein [Colletotrichum camelliae]